MSSFLGVVGWSSDQIGGIISSVLVHLTSYLGNVPSVTRSLFDTSFIVEDGIGGESGESGVFSAKREGGVSSIG